MECNKRITILFLVLLQGCISFMSHCNAQTKKISKRIKNCYKSEGYKLVWNDEFYSDGKPDSSNWDYEIGFKRNNELQWYHPDNAICKNGKLVIEAQRIDIPNPNYKSNSSNWRESRKKVEYTSSCLITKGKHQWQYGRFEIKARIDTTKGSWPAIWTLGIDKPWPSNGEIDLLEFYIKDNKQSILANVASGTATKWKAKWDSVIKDLSYFIKKDPLWVKKFHVWRMDWDKDYIRLYLDDELLNETPLRETTNPDGFQPFHQPHYLLLNLAIGSNGGDPQNSKFPITYEIDYVRVYQKR